MAGLSETSSGSLTAATKPLSEFSKIGYNTYIFTPSSYSASNPPLILVFAWNAAAAKHIAKYTATYQNIFPSSRIVLVRCYTPDMFQSDRTYRTRLEPVLNIVKEHTVNGGDILVHSFSNGGGNQLVAFSKAWAKQEGFQLPMRALILDSSPGKGGWARSHAAIVASLPQGLFWRLVGKAVVHLLLASVFLFDIMTRRENIMVVMCRLMNDPAIFDLRTPRVYLYSKADVMVGYEEVEDHADECAYKGWNVTKVRFHNSAHAGHIREDEGKYWGAVKEVWQRGRPA